MTDRGDVAIRDFFVNDQLVYVSQNDSITFVGERMRTSKWRAAWRVLRGEKVEMHGEYWIRYGTTLVVDKLYFTVGSEYRYQRKGWWWRFRMRWCR